MCQYRMNCAIVALLVLAAFFCASTAVVARAEIIIISDTFTAADGTSLSGRYPDVVNLPGSSYQRCGAGVEHSHVIQSNTALLSTDLGEAVSMDSVGAYEKPTQFTISASLHVGDLTITSGTIRGMGLGFYSERRGVYPSNGFTNFCGVVLDPNGKLWYVDGSILHQTMTSTTSPLAYQGTWNAAAWHTLQYDVDTTAGTVSNVLLDGTSYSFTGGNPVFTDAQTKFAGFLASSSSANGGYVDNFVVSKVPEPSTLALLSCGLAGLLCYAWRRRK